MIASRSLLSALTARRLVPAALLPWAFACDLFEPSVRDGVYTLATVNGRELPAIRIATIECDRTLEGGSLVIGSENRISFQVLEQSDCTRGGGGVLSWYRSYTGRYTITGGTMTVAPATLDGPSAIHAEIEFGGHVVAVIDPLDYGSGPGLLRFAFIGPAPPT